MTQPTDTSSKSEETTRAAGRGGLAIAVAKVAFILFGFAQQVVLPLKGVLGVDGYGAFRTVVMNNVSVVNNVIVAVAIQGVSRAVSQVPDAEAGRAFRRALSVHAIIAVIVASTFAALAGSIAQALAAPYVATPLRIASLVVLFYGLYAPLVGSLNGRRRFLDQAGLDISYGFIRLVAMVGAAVTFAKSGALGGSLGPGGSGVLGASIGFVCAAFVILPIAVSRSGLGQSGGDKPAIKDYLSFLFPLALGQLCLNALMQTDSTLMSRFVGKAAGEGDAGIKLANTLRGVYAGAQLFAFLPYQLLMSITFVLFPMLAKASAEGDSDAVRSYTRTGMRLGLVLTGMMCGTVAAIAPHVLHLAFPEEIWSQGGGVLRVLALGMGAFTILGISSAALTGLGRAVHAMVLNAIGVALVAGACYTLVPGAAIGPAMLERAALSASIGLTLTAIAGGVVLYRVAGGFVAPLSLVRVIIATAIAITAGSRLPWMGKPAVLVEAALIGALYLVILIVTKEVGRADLDRIVTVIGKRRSKGAA